MGIYKQTCEENVINVGIYNKYFIDPLYYSYNKFMYVVEFLGLNRYTNNVIDNLRFSYNTLAILSFIVAIRI